MSSHTDYAGPDYVGRFGKPLAPRELEILSNLARTGSQKETAVQLGMSLQTVKNLLARSRERLGVGTTIEVYYRLGWLVPEGNATLGNAVLVADDLEARLEAIHAMSGDLLAELRRARLEAVA